MPTYGYHCSRCQTEFEVFQRMTDEPIADCPSCGGAGRRLFYPAGIVFKGSGFYKTDSRARSSTSGGGEKKKAEASTPAAASTGSDSGSGGGTSSSATPKKKAAASSGASTEA